MLAANVDRILADLPDDALVLDIGGWAQPFNRADYVVDLLPFETRAGYGSIGSGPERFSAHTWIRLDISSHSLPFDDDFFDFVICSHTLEDIRDPIAASREIARVGKRGYVEVPSRAVESTFGVEGRRYAGYCHHRWLVEVQDSTIVFRLKPHLIHETRRSHLPKRFLSDLSEADRVTWLDWSGSFEAVEAIEIDKKAMEHDLERFVDARLPLGRLEKLLDAAAAPRQAITRLLRRERPAPTAGIPTIVSGPERSERLSG